MTTAIATRPAQLVNYLERRVDDFKAVSTVQDPARFMRILKNAVMRDPLIAEATEQSVFLECQKACQDGLMLDGREAVLTRFRSRRKDNNGSWHDVVEVAYIPMVRGIRKLVMRSGQIKVWSVELVHRLDVEEGRFKYTRAPVAEIRHEPTVIGDPGPVVGCYSYVEFKDGGTSIEYMRVDQLDAIMARTKSKKQDGTITGPWATDKYEMYRKTVIRRHFKYLPTVDEQAQEAIERVDALYDMSPDEYEADPTPPPPSVAKARKMSAAGALAKAAKAQAAETPHDEETGDVHEGEILPPDDGAPPHDSVPDDEPEF
jgi:recombination protein RecT